MSKNGCKVYTSGARLFDILKPDPELIRLEDIAYALSNICRWGRHCVPFASVAEHCVLVAKRLQPQGISAARWGLLHDASEAYVGDIVSQIKDRLHIDNRNFRAVEDGILYAVSKRFGLVWPIPKTVHDEDLAVRDDERSVLIVHSEPLGSHGIDGLRPREAERRFLAMATELEIK